MERLLDAQNVLRLGFLCSAIFCLTRVLDHMRAIEVLQTEVLHAS
jgi:hypothetical protein